MRSKIRHFNYCQRATNFESLKHKYITKLPVNNKPMYEFCKLDSIDLKVASWLFCHCPNTLYSYLEFLADRDTRYQLLKLNAQKLFDELNEVHAFTKKPTLLKKSIEMHHTVMEY